MNNKWQKTCAALKDLLDILRCSKCNSSLHDSKQFLNCGHFSCTSCTNVSDTCSDCKSFSEVENVITDNKIKKIVQVCSNIVRELTFGLDVEDIQTESISSLQLGEPLNLKEEILNPPLNPLPKNFPKKLQKRKRNKNSNDNNNFKKSNCNKTEFMRIPKKINKRNHLGETKLQEECKKGNIKYVEHLLTAGANPDIACNANWTPLQECADFGYYEIVKMLLKAGANVNKLGHECKTALHEAAKNNNSKMIELLLTYNANKEIVDKNGMRPIDYCQSLYCKKLLELKPDKQFNLDIMNTINSNSLETLSISADQQSEMNELLNPIPSIDRDSCDIEIIDEIINNIPKSIIYNKSLQENFNITNISNNNETINCNSQKCIDNINTYKAKNNIFSHNYSQDVNSSKIDTNKSLFFQNTFIRNIYPESEDNSEIIDIMN